MSFTAKGETHWTRSHRNTEEHILENKSAIWHNFTIAFEYRLWWYMNTSGTAELRAGAREAFKDTFYLVFVWVFTSLRYMIKKQASGEKFRFQNTIEHLDCLHMWINLSDVSSFFVIGWHPKIPLQELRGFLLLKFITFGRKGNILRESLPEIRRNCLPKE